VIDITSRATIDTTGIMILLFKLLLFNFDILQTSEAESFHLCYILYGVG
jgi:hypothetical protein